MAISNDDVAAVRAATDIVAVISEHVGLKRTGRRFSGLCPFHGEKSPSFSVNAEQGLYYCFGCGARGDAISFVREIEHLDFVEAVEKLAARAGIPITHTDERFGTDRKHRQLLTDTMSRAVEWYHERLLSSPDASEARSYLRARGLTGVTVRQFKIGWAPDDWDLLAKHLNVSKEVLEETGLGFVNRRGNKQDAFRARVLFPIFDPGGAPIALGGRILGSASDGQPKYKNSPETTLYSKRRTLYALNWAKDEAVKQSQIIVCEGYTDVIGCFTSGLPFAVATCGTALAEEHVRLLKKYVNRVVLAYDADGAGQAAAERFYAWEKEFEIDLVVAEFPSGKDPGDLARNNPEQLRAAIAEAKPFLAFRIDRLFGRSETKSPEARARVADKVIELIKEHPNQLVRDQYLIDAADRLRIEPNQLRERLDKGSTSRSTQSQQPTVRRTNVATVVTAATNVERSAVLLTVQHPAVIAELLVGLSGAVAANVAEGVDGLSALAAALFSDDRYLRAMLVLLAHDNVHDAMDQASPDVAELLGQLSVEDEPPGVEQEIADQVADTFALLFVAASRRASQELRRRSIESGETFDLGELRQSAEDLLRADTRSGAMRRLLPWLLVAEGE